MNLNDLKKIKSHFIEEIRSAQALQESSLPFIIHQLPSDPVISAGDHFQAITIGGTNYSLAHGSIAHDGKVMLEKGEHGQRPNFHSEEDFYKFLSGIVGEDVEYLAINFAFPLEPVFRDGLLDGKLRNSGKNDNFGGLVGKILGESIEKYLGTGIHISCANDTICLLLAGLDRCPKSQLAAGIVGTGYNTAFFMDENQAINLQSASFDKFAISDVTQRINESAQNKGGFFEKEVSGAYLYQHFNLAGGVHRQIESSERLDEIAKDESDPDFEIARAIFEHSAQLVSTHIAGIMEYKQSDMHFIMQGSIYWNAWNYKESVEQWVKQLCPQFTVQFFEVEDADLWGAAHLLV